MSTIRLLDKARHQMSREKRKEVVAIVVTQPLKWRLEQPRARNILELIRVHQSSMSGAEKDRRFTHLLSWIFHGRPLGAQPR